MKFILIRKQIYEKSFFNEWKYSIYIIKVAENHFLNKNRKILSNCIQLFIENVQQIRYERDIEDKINFNHLILIKKQIFVEWIRERKLKTRSNLFRESYGSRIVENYYYFWVQRFKNRVLKSNKEQYIVSIHVHRHVAMYFHKWYDRLIKRMNIDKKIIKCQRNTRKHILNQNFDKWIGHFNMTSYLTNREFMITELDRIICLKSCLRLWINKYDSVICKNSDLDNSESSFEIWKKNKYFIEWRSLYVTHKLERIRLSKLNRALRKANQKRALNKWNIRFMESHNEKKMVEMAKRFNTLSLLYRCFETLRVHKNILKHEKDLNRRARTFAQMSILSKAMKGWKANHFVISRRCFLVTSVLTQWSKSLEQKYLQQISISITAVLDKRKKPIRFSG